MPNVIAGTGFGAVVPSIRSSALSFSMPATALQPTVEKSTGSVGDISKYLVQMVSVVFAPR